MLQAMGPLLPPGWGDPPPPAGGPSSRGRDERAQMLDRGGREMLEAKRVHAWDVLADDARVARQAQRPAERDAEVEALVDAERPWRREAHAARPDVVRQRPDRVAVVARQRHVE